MDLPLNNNNLMGQSVDFDFGRLEEYMYVYVCVRINKLRVREGQANRRRTDYITTNTQKEKERRG